MQVRNTTDSFNSVLSALDAVTDEQFISCEAFRTSDGNIEYLITTKDAPVAETPTSTGTGESPEA